VPRNEQMSRGDERCCCCCRRWATLATTNMQVWFT
jgi:hypothetical protein